MAHAAGAAPHPSTLRLLVAVADRGSVSKAAQSVGMAQPNASRALSALERSLGYPLLARSSSGSQLTPQGVLTVEWAREVVDALDRFEVGTSAIRSGGGELTIGASMTIAEYLAPGWLSALRADQPELHTSLHIDNSANIIDRVRRGLLTIGFIETPEVPSGMHVRRIGADHLTVVIPPEHPWAGLRGRLTKAELAATPLVEREPGSGTRAALDVALGGLDRARPIAELNSNSAITQSIMAGLGPAVLSVLAVRGALLDGRLLSVPLADGPLGRDLNAIWFGASHLSGPNAKLLEIASASLDEHGAGWAGFGGPAATAER